MGRRAVSSQSRAGPNSALGSLWGRGLISCEPCASPAELGLSPWAFPTRGCWCSSRMGLGDTPVLSRAAGAARWLPVLEGRWPRLRAPSHSSCVLLDSNRQETIFFFRAGRLVGANTAPFSAAAVPGARRTLVARTLLAALLMRPPRQQWAIKILCCARRLVGANAAPLWPFRRLWGDGSGRRSRSRLSRGVGRWPCVRA